MATQEPNVYAGLPVVIGGLMHARPRFFAKVMGELLFWVGEDKMLFGSDYAIWEPKWQIEGFLDWDYPDDDEFSDYPRLDDDGKKKILGPQRRQAVRHRGARGVAGRRAPADEDAGVAGERGRVRGACSVRAVLDALGDGLRPGARRADHLAAVRGLVRGERRRRRRGARCGCPRRSARPTSRS